MEQVPDELGPRVKRAWLIHDTRTPGFLTAVLLARRLGTEGFLCQSVAGSEERRGRRGIVTEEAKDFWIGGIRAVQNLIAPGDRLYLCSITLDTKGDLAAMRAVWADIRSTLGDKAVIVLSQRWPDHYAEIDAKSYLVPLEFPDEQRTRTDHFERSIADLIFVASHQADPLEVPPSDLTLLDQMGIHLRSYYRAEPRTEQARRDADEEEFDPARRLFDVLVNEDSGKKELDGWRKAPPIPPPDWNANVLSESHAYVITIPPDEKEHRQGKLRAVLGRSNSHRFAVGVGVQDRQHEYRILLVRRDDVVVDRPSLLRMLLQSDRVPHEGWLPADENTLTFVPHLATETKWLNCGKEKVQQSVQRWVEDVAENLVGDLGAPAALAKVLCQAGDDALAKLDLAGSYFPKSLHFRPSDTIIRFDHGNRSPEGEIRRTLILTLEVVSAQALAFLMRGNGYVLSKLEMQLEGVRLGLLNARSPWLWSVRLAERIRINTDVDPAAIGPDKVADLSTRLAQDVTAESLNDIPSSSVIGKALHEAGAQRVIAYRETEMIGPSVQYGRVAAALAAVLARGRDANDSLQVLDLFSGSGFSAWALKQECKSASLICVDGAVPFDQTLVSNQRDILWLRTSVEDVVGVGGREGILSREYDLIVMDPPHAALLEMLFGGLVETLLTRSPWLVVYQGHTSQSGRGRALVAALTEFSRNPKRPRRVAIATIDSEELVISGPLEWKRGRNSVSFVGCLEECRGERGLSSHSVRILDPETGAPLGN